MQKRIQDIRSCINYVCFLNVKKFLSVNLIFFIIWLSNEIFSKVYSFIFSPLHLFGLLNQEQTLNKKVLFNTLITVMSIRHILNCCNIIGKNKSLNTIPFCTCLQIQEDFHAVIEWGCKIDPLCCISMHGTTERYLSGQKADTAGFVRLLLGELESRISVQFRRVSIGYTAIILVLMSK